MKQITKLLLLTAVIASLLAACHITPPTDPAFQKDWAESMEEEPEDFGDAWYAWDGDPENAGKNHYWKVLDGEENEVCVITDEEQIKQVDELLSDDGAWGEHITGDPGDPAYTYVFCQEETLKAGQDPDDRDYDALVSFTVSASENVVTLKILEGLSSPLGADLGDYLTFAFEVPAETAEELRTFLDFLPPAASFS